MLSKAMLALFLPAASAQMAYPMTAAGMKVFAMTQYGNITGRYSRIDGVNRFYGVPVGATTAGANRFKEPLPPTPWTGIKDTIETKICFYSLGSPVGEEDCLAVDVVAPANPMMLPGNPTVAPPNTYPCQVWFHGGGFEVEETGFWQGKDNFYASNDQAHLPNMGKIVTIFPRYRLSVLGAASHPALRNGIGGNMYSGSYQMFDALNALRWIQNNIPNFGGNPSMVTIQGQSAGATLSATLVASPLTYSGAYATGGPLISGAAMHSKWQTTGYGTTYSQKCRDAATAGTIAMVGCYSSPDSLNLPLSTLTTIASCLRGTSPVLPLYIQDSAFGLGSALTAAFEGVYGANTWSMISTQSLSVYPVVDGYALPMSPKELYTAGYGAGVKIMLGQTVDDDGPFYSKTPYDTSVPAQAMAYKMNFGFLWAGFSNPAMNYTIDITTATALTLSMPIGPVASYYSGFVDPYQKQIAGITDLFFSVDQNNMFDILAAQPGRTPGTVYRFLYAEGPEGAYNSVPLYGAAHMLDLTYIWGLNTFGKNIMTDNYGIIPGTFTMSDAKMTMGKTIKSYWSTFFATGSPNLVGSGLPTWSPITTTEKHTMVLQSTVPFGAILDPCAMFAACVVEPTADFRRSMHTFFTSPMVAGATGPPLPTCSPVTVGFTRQAPYTYASQCTVTITPPVAPTAMGGKCATTSSCASGLTCKCVASSGRRELLFGMPSSGSGDCYCL